MSRAPILIKQVRDRRWGRRALRELTAAAHTVLEVFDRLGQWVIFGTSVHWRTKEDKE